jgi:hypothetical protein
LLSNRLRALSTPESTTPIPASGGGGSGNMFKFTATKYRYSKDEILALRANVTERLAEDVRNEILENLKDVESVFRPNIIEPLTLSTPSVEENVREKNSFFKKEHESSFVFLDKNEFVNKLYFWSNTRWWWSRGK